MSQLRSLAPDNCPHCAAPHSLYIAEDRRLTCRLCGHKVSRIKSLGEAASDDSPEKSPSPTPAAPAKPAHLFKPKPKPAAAPVMPESTAPLPAGKVPRRTGFRVTEGILHGEPITAWTQARYSTALQYVRQEHYDEALKAFHRALDEDRDFIDAHLWIARLTEDAAERREHLGEILAQQPGHLEAMREMMILNGQLTEEEAARSVSEHYDPAVESPGVPVSVQGQELKCKVCGGEMTVGDDGTQVFCAFCGHREALTRQADYGLKSITMALLKRRGQETLWSVGEHLLQCKSCGAERTVPAQRLSERCPFCGSKLVIEKDALNSFQQPDGVIPFALSREAAEDAIDEALNSGFERLKSFFVNNQVKSIDLEGVYVPCWLFDMVIQVKRTIIDQGSQNDPFGRTHSQLAYRQETLTDMANDVPVYAVKSPSPRLLESLGRSDVEAVVPYEPKLLAEYTALMYAIDFDKASLAARDTASRMMREDHGFDLNRDTQVTVMPMVQQMLFRLVLIPVWVATITEEDGDLRPCLVHGQTGKVAKGKARKP